MQLTSLVVTRDGGIKEERGFPFERTPLPHVPVGIPNRGKTGRRLAIGKHFISEIRGERIEQGSFKLIENDVTLLVEPQESEANGRIAVLLKAESGFRGTSEIDVEDEKKTVILRGEVWDSENGTLGVNEVALMIVRPGDQITINRTGRLYGAPEKIVVSVDNDYAFKATPLEVIKAKAAAEKDEEGKVL